MKESLFFIVMRGTDELMIDRAFDSKNKAQDYIDQSLLNKKAVQIKEAVYQIKEKK